MPGLFVECGSAAVDGVVANSVHDIAASSAVRQNLDNAGGIVHILPIADISGANNGVMALVGAGRVRDLVDREDQNNYEHGSSNTESNPAAETSCSSGPR